MFVRFVRYHVRPAIKYYTTGVTPLTVIGAVTIVALFAMAYGTYFATVRQGRVAVDVSLLHLRALTLEFVLAFLAMGLRRRPGLVTFCSSTPVKPADALRLILLTNAGTPLRAGVAFIAFVLPFALRLSPSVERAVLHVVSDAVSVLLHYFAAALIAALWHRGRKGGACAVVGFLVLVGMEWLAFRRWPEVDFMLPAVNVAACVACWTVVTGRLDAAHLQRFLASAVPKRGGRSTLGRVLRPLPVEAKLYAKDLLLRRESAISVLATLALFAGLIGLLITGIPEETRAATIIAFMYMASLSAVSVLHTFDRQRLTFFKTTPVAFGRLTYAMLAIPCAAYAVAAAIVGPIGVAGGMGFGSVLVLLSQGVFLALVTWLIPFRFLYGSRLFGSLVYGMIVTAGLFLAIAATVVEAGFVAYAAFVLLIPAILYPGASVRFQDSTVEDWAPAT